MNYFELYPGDYLRDTTRLTLIEHGAYLRLLMAYYAEESPLPADYGELYVIVSAVSAADKAAVKKVADRFFPVDEDGARHNGRADDEIAKAAERMEGAESRKSNDALRKQRSREYRSKLFAELRVVGIVPDGTLPMADLKALHAKHVTRTGHVTHGVTGRDKSRDIGRDNTGNQTPDPTSHVSVGKTEASTEISQGTSTEAGRACRLLREAGCARVNPSHPDLLAALAEGVTPEAIRDTYVATPDARNPFAYAIATARGLHADGARSVPTGPPRRANDQPSRTRTALETLQARKRPDELPTRVAEERGPGRLVQARDAEP
ncbi:MAG: YdaU family protein [Dyella sp.]|uniref:YdaU family protein n=1 Tax=Dyella sp. TaxID=1869338 RepID=UPI003F7CE2BA